MKYMLLVLSPILFAFIFGIFKSTVGYAQPETTNNIVLTSEESILVRNALNYHLKHEAITSNPEGRLNLADIIKISNLIRKVDSSLCNCDCQKSQ